MNTNDNVGFSDKEILLYKIENEIDVLKVYNENGALVKKVKPDSWHGTVTYLEHNGFKGLRARYA
jgi:hypothetical protein